jgi:hypothetical protein
MGVKRKRPRHRGSLVAKAVDLDRGTTSHEALANLLNQSTQPNIGGRRDRAADQAAFEAIAELADNPTLRKRAARGAEIVARLNDPTTPMPERIALLKEMERHRDQSKAQADRMARKVQRAARLFPKKPDPTLADELMFNHKAYSDMMPRKLNERIRTGIRDSRKFVYDASASRRVAELCLLNADMIADYSEFVRLPYEKTWIELDARAMFKRLQPLADSNHQPDDRIGFLFDGDDVFVGVSAQPANGGKPSYMLMPVSYHLQRPMVLEQELKVSRLLGISRGQLDHFLWGEAYDRLDPSRRRALRHQHTVDFPIFPAMERAGLFGNFLTGGGTGDLKLLLAAAMLLMRPNLTRVIREKTEDSRLRTITGVRTFLAHKVVTVKLRQEPMVKRIHSALCAVRNKVRRHEVRGHYCHNRAAKRSQCIHDWLETKPDHWECQLPGCTAARWWRKPHERGDASVGVVTKHYHVTDGRQAA